MLFLLQYRNIPYHVQVARDGVVVKALRTNGHVAGSIPEGVIGIFR